MSLPRCPRCMTPIQYDWDYCHTCGLSAEEIMAGLADESAAVTDIPDIADVPPAPPAPPAPAGTSIDAGPSEWSPPADDPFGGGGFDQEPWDEGEDDDPFAGMGTGGSDPEDPRTSASPPAGSAPPGAFGVAAVGGIAGAASGAPGFGGAAAAGPDPFAASGAPSAPSGTASAPPSAAATQDPGGGPPTAGRAGGAGGGHPGMTLMDDAPAARNMAPVLGGGVPRAGIIGGVALFGLLILFLLVFGRGRADDPTLGSGSTAPPLGAVGLNRTTVSGGGITGKTEKYAEGRAGWIIFKPDDGSFSIEVPKPPNNVKNTSVTLKSGEVQALSFSVADANGGYFVAISDVPDGDPQEVLKEFIVAYGKAIDFRSTTGGGGTHFDLPSRDFVYENDNQQQMNARAVKVGARVYVLGAGGTDPSAYFWEHFRDTFKPGP